jgi:hypothetical protein
MHGVVIEGQRELGDPRRRRRNMDSDANSNTDSFPWGLFLGRFLKAYPHQSIKRGPCKHTLM